MRRIPIKNVYYLLLYAWDRFTPGHQTEVGEEGGPDLPNLLARILVDRTRGLMRRGLDRGYESKVEETGSPRGRFLVGESARRTGLVRGRLVCQFDDLSVDVVHNRILKAALGVLAQSPGIEASLFAELQDLRVKLAAVTDAPLSRHLFTQLQLSRNTGHYGLLMKICEMLLELSIPQQGGRGSRFADILQDEKRMAAIFEAFVRNFYRREQDVFSVASELIAWNVGPESPGHARYLPSMLTDVTLRSPDRTIVVDAKFYQQTLVSRLGGQEKVRSDHLYQIVAYLKNLAARKGPDERAEGLLLYPRTGGSELRLDFQLVGHRVRACTIDLTKQWTDIHQEMFALLAT